ncbi:hypothetical protein ASE15_01440 [Oerskovia sp. Root22]|nr:hypothetical protein ASE15_01440 [Oerskovia sp. Root22]
MASPSGIAESPGVEDAVAGVYRHLAFAPEFFEVMRAGMRETLDDLQSAERLAARQLAEQLEALDTQEENLVDLAADGTLATGEDPAAASRHRCPTSAPAREGDEGHSRPRRRRRVH